MKALHFFMGLGLFLGLAAVGMAFIISPWVPEVIQIPLAWGADWPDWAKIAAGVGLIAYVFIYLLTGLRWARRSFITFENANGTVSVSAGALEEYLNSLKNEFAAIGRMKSRLRAVRGALEVHLALSVRDGTQIPELCRLLQTRVREVLEEHLGSFDLRGVAVEVAEIRPRKGSSVENPTP